jgi:integrase
MIDPKQIAPLLRAIDDYSGSYIVKSALRLAPLVFVRPGELRHAEWEHIDLEAKEWRYLVTKTQTPHIVPLSKQAVNILEAMKPLTGNGRYVCFQAQGHPTVHGQCQTRRYWRHLGAWASTSPK